MPGAPPYPAAPDFPRKRGKGGGVSHQRGRALRARRLQPLRGYDYKVSVTGLAFMSPVVHDKEPVFLRVLRK